jgi:hypothetical protein
MSGQKFGVVAAGSLDPGVRRREAVDILPGGVVLAKMINRSSSFRKWRLNRLAMLARPHLR